MSDVIFARPRHNYDSYQDLYRLIELSGYSLIFSDEIDPHSDNRYILTMLNGDTQNGWEGATAHVTLWDLEWRLDGFTLPAGVRDVWTSDCWYSQQLQRHGLPCRYVPLGSHQDLNYYPSETTPHEYDAALMAYMGPPRRQQVAYELRQRGIRLASNGWCDERDLALRKSRSVLNIHQHDNIPAVSAQRFALAAAYRLPVITETLTDAGIFDHTTIMQSDYGNMVDFAEMWLCRNDGHMLQEWGFALHYLLCEKHTFRKCVEAAV